MYKVMYLPEAINVYDVHGVAQFITKEQAANCLIENNIYRVNFVSICEGNLMVSKKHLGWPYKRLSKHLFEIVEVN